jgi:uncharacterized BrkB/YihY/UPF0761 family membrane protein
MQRQAYQTAPTRMQHSLWIYYSAQIFFFGAEFTHVYAESQGLHAGAAAKDLEAQAGMKMVNQV